MRRGRQLLEDLIHVGGQAAQTRQLLLVGSKLLRVGQLATQQEKSHLFKLAVLGEIGNVITAIVQVVAGAAHRAESRISGRRS